MQPTEPTGLPAGWDVVTTGGGLTYYLNVVTGDTQKELPTTPSLADGWDMAVSKSTGAVYFVNHVTNEISHTPPAVLQISKLRC